MAIGNLSALSRVSSAGLWALLAWPAIPLVADFWENARHYPELMHQSGVFSIQLLVATLLVTPINFALKFNRTGINFARWLMKRRRNLGVASFFYALLHVMFYVREIADLRLIILEAVDFELAIGWIGFAIIVVLAITANDWSVRKLLNRWKSLHRWVYPAAALTFLHWYLFEFFASVALSWIVPLCLTRVMHIILRGRLKYKRRRSLAA